MKILHTSDWHLGASLEEASREADHRAFLDWLVETVRQEGIEVLIVAGDVFDTATPSAEAQGLYYRFLHRLGGTDLRQVVVVGGNHDSAARLDAPRELLAAFGIHVVGGLDGPQDLDRCLCPVTDAEGQVRLVIAAVPFAHEWRLGYRSAETTAESTERLGEPFRRLYADLADRAQALHPGVPLVATGHLAVAGSAKDDAPQEIHLIGSLGGLPTGIFDARYAYVALGHIHRGYRVGGTAAHYCGSPIALNVKEGRHPRTVNRVELGASGEAVVDRLEVPGTRQVLELRGDLATVQARLAALDCSGDLPPMVKVDLQVARFQVGLEEALRDFLAALDPRPVLVGLTQTALRVAEADPEGTPAPPPRLAELTPRDVFRLLCEARGERHEELAPLFETLMNGEVQA